MECVDNCIDGTLPDISSIFVLPNTYVQETPIVSTITEPTTGYAIALDAFGKPVFTADKITSEVPKLTFTT